MIPENIINPYNVDPQMEFPHRVVNDVENWTEYHYFFAYDADKETGISFHIGRLAGDLTVWRTILYVYLPNGEVLLRRLSGRGETARSFSCGPLLVTCVEPFRLWTVDFDGAMQRVDRTALFDGPLIDDIDEIVRFSIRFEAAAPFYSLDPHDDAGLPNMGWAKDHYEQIHRIKGEISYGSHTLSLTGMGVRDHSSGPRNTGKPYGGCFVNLLFPSGKAISFTKVITPNYDDAYGYMYWGDGTPIESIKVISTMPINDGNTPDGTIVADVLEDQGCTIILETSRGEQRIEVDYRHAITTTYVAPHDEVAGTDYRRPDAAQQTKIAALCTADGETGIAQLDRYVRIRSIRRPK